MKKKIVACALWVVRNWSDIKRKALTIIGDIKIYPYPFWLVYDPTPFGISGSKIRQVIDVLKPGDIVGRSYKDYLDSRLIPGKYSHTGIYIGDGMMIHAVAEGVCKIDVLDFLMCDGCIVFRPKDQSKVAAALECAEKHIGVPYDFDFKPGTEHLYCHELSATCYPDFKIEKHIPSILGGFVKGKTPVFLAQSFEESPDFETVLEIE